MLKHRAATNNLAAEGIKMMYVVEHVVWHEAQMLSITCSMHPHKGKP